jgi:hypothetical protein
LLKQFEINMYKDLKKCIENGDVYHVSPDGFSLSSIPTYQTRLTRELGRKVKLTYNGKCIYDLLSGLNVDALNKAHNKVKSGHDLTIHDRGEVYSCLREIKRVAEALGYIIDIDMVDINNDQDDL